ncbi:DUF4344 domain-containing metallopeptidase [Luteimonas terrae]|uniref:Uncharacterized protein YceK n=1 Tax=Luteimonas terrae TaxID=1530191 RepID=A0ABU1Y0S1_9GAMM|nr:DUF4344 domain-containing metallopeptidase [Luteimonas terrae]MDR7194624.1 uncharacterized protein YceK [Luteimonas terrae]
MRFEVWMTVLLMASLVTLSGCASVSAPAAGAMGDAAHRPSAQPVPRALVRYRRTSAAAAATLAAPAFEYAYDVPASPDLQPIFLRVRDADLLRSLPEVQAIDGMFVLPRRLRFVTAECGEFGAFYRPGTGEVVLCYETLRTLYERGQTLQRSLGLGDDYPLRYTRANLRFIVLHETGHALVHLLDLPVTGRQEDAVDQLAAILMLRFAALNETPDEVIGNLRMAANWMLSDSTGAYNLNAYADEHALGEQRYFNLQCLIYGTDPAAFAGMVDTGDLTAARAAGCEREMRQTARAWLRLLLPHLAPGYEAYEEEAARYIGRTPGR